MNLAPTWIELAEKFNNQNEVKVKIAEVDCDENEKTCRDNDVKSYPTLKLFKLNSDEAVTYQYTRDFPTLTQFINEQLGISEPLLEETYDDDTESYNEEDERR